MPYKDAGRLGPGPGLGSGGYRFAFGAMQPGGSRQRIWNSMSDRRLPPNAPPARFWIVLPAVILLLADTLMTFLFQPTSYWAEGYANRV